MYLIHKDQWVKDSSHLRLFSEWESEGRSKQQPQINQSNFRSHEHISASLHWYPGTRGSHAPFCIHTKITISPATIFYTCIQFSEHGRLMNVGVLVFAFIHHNFNRHNQFTKLLPTKISSFMYLSHPLWSYFSRAAFILFSTCGGVATVREQVLNESGPIKQVQYTQDSWRDQGKSKIAMTSFKLYEVLGMPFRQPNIPTFYGWKLNYRG